MTGKDIIVVLSQGGTALASTYIKSDDIQTQCDSIEKASSTQQDWVEVVAGRKKWSLTIGYLVMASAQVSRLLLVGEMFDIQIKSGSTVLLSGKALMTGVSGKFTVGTLAQGTFTLTGNGALAVPTQ